MVVGFDFVLNSDNLKPEQIIRLTKNVYRNKATKSS